MEIESLFHFAGSIASEADIETLESYEKRIHHYENMNYTYIPIPKSNKYYNTDEGWLRDINERQYIHEETHLVNVVRRLRNHPFLLLDYEFNTFVVVAETDNSPDIITYGVGHTEEPLSKEEAKERIDLERFDVDENNVTIFSTDEFRREFEADEYDDLILFDSNFNRYEIITLADLNKREMRDMLYRIFAELVSELGKKIENEYPEPDSILRHIQPHAIGRWKKDQIRGLDLHIAEHINLIDMMNIIRASDDGFVEDCGFESKEDVNLLKKINSIRNSVMHANRTLVYDRHDIDSVLEAISQAERILKNIS